MTKITNNIK